MESEYQEKLSKVEELKEKEILKYKKSVEENNSKYSDKSLNNLRSEISKKDLEFNSNLSKLKNENEQMKSDNFKLEKDLMFMYKLIKTISSEKYQANSLLFNKELDDKLRPENLPALFKMLEKRNLNNFLSYSKVGLSD